MAGDVGPVRVRQAAGGNDEPLRRNCVTGVGRDAPALCCFISHGGCHALVEAVVLTHVEAVSDELEVPQNLGLRCIALAPTSGVLQLRVERVRVVQALHVAARARVAAPVPRAAHVRTGFNAENAVASALGVDRAVAAGEASTNDKSVNSCANEWVAWIAAGTCR